MEVEKSCPEQLNSNQIKKFSEQGFLIFNDFLSPDELQIGKQGILESLEDFRKGYQSGKVSLERNKNRPYNYTGQVLRFKDSDYRIQFEPSSDLDFNQVTCEEMEFKFRKIFSFEGRQRSLDKIYHNPKVHQYLKDLLGDGYILHNNQMLCKPQEIGVAKPWHQDQAYHHYIPIGSGVTVWIPLDDCTIDNGCMHIMPKKHKEGPLQHVLKDDLCLDDAEVNKEDIVPVEIKAGTALFFSCLLPHMSPPNLSSGPRRSFQFFFRGPSTKIVSEDIFRENFVKEKGRCALPA